MGTQEQEDTNRILNSIEHSKSRRIPDSDYAWGMHPREYREHPNAVGILNTNTSIWD